MTFSQNGYGNASEQFNIAMEHVPLVEWFAYYVHCHFPLQTVRFPKATLMENHKTQISWYIPFWGQLYHTYIWANYNNSQTWNKAIWGSFPLLTIVPVRSQWGRYNLPRYIYIYRHLIHLFPWQILPIPMDFRWFQPEKTGVQHDLHDLAPIGQVGNPGSLGLCIQPKKLIALDTMSQKWAKHAN